MLYTMDMQEDEESNNIRGHSLQTYLDALYEKRGSTREKALLGLIDAFSRNLDIQFAENNYITMQHQFINSVKRGSATEVSQATRALGLLAVTIGCGDKAHEIMEESIPVLSHAIRSFSESMKRLSVIECLAILTFVGGNDSEETYRSLEIIWQLINPEPGSKVALENKQTTDVLATAISAWSFLLTTVKRFKRLKLDSNDWQESISFISSLLDKDDHALRVAAGDALGVIFELGGLKKFCDGAKNYTDSSVIKENDVWGGFECLEGLKTKIQSQMRSLSVESADQVSNNKDVNSERNSFEDLSAFLQTGDCSETSMEASSWSEMIQLNFLRRLFGSDFCMHMQQNKFLHDVFNPIHKKKKHSSGNAEYTLDNERDTDLFYIPRQKKDGADTFQRLYKSPNSAYNKARTQVLNKKRSFIQDWKNGHFADQED
ncbi:uncharacterized protein LOC131218964 [Magnolia sinica]|uniref:uncharacterized protein LOC131218964 n=1 Tax=Magnolia sinica TaxID=86752 RepID=UPI002659BD84|nr:uncharacterized protein LOC131218964 [Magnolia sinica]